MTTKSNIIKATSQEDFPNDMERLFYQNSDEKVVLNRHLEKLLSNQRFGVGLDIGAGPGLLSQSLYSRCDHLVLLELLPTYKKILQQKYPKAEVIIKSFLEWDSEYRFDLILCSHVLYYVNQQTIAATLNKMRNLLSKQGTLIIILVDNTDFLTILPQLARSAKVNLVALNCVVDSLKNFSKSEMELIDYSNEKLFINADEFLQYLQAYFTVEKRTDLLKYANEIATAKHLLLKKRNNHLVLNQTGKIIVLRNKL